MQTAESKVLCQPLNVACCFEGKSNRDVNVASFDSEAQNMKHRQRLKELRWHYNGTARRAHNMKTKINNS
jgi:hypothetical protein